MKEYKALVIKAGQITWDNRVFTKEALQKMAEKGPGRYECSHNGDLYAKMTEKEKTAIERKRNTK